jgi:hypothetical protein
LWDAGIRPKSWHGASIAKELMKINKVEEHHPNRTVVMHTDGGSHFEYPEGEPVHGVLDKAAYFGGRFEISAHGLIDRPVYGYDITSAYPDEIRSLPTWKDSHWEHSRHHSHILKHVGWFLALVSWEGPDDLMWMPFGHRTSSELTFPRSIYRQWVWSPEVRVAAEFYPQHLTVHEAYLLHTDTDARPFAYLEDLFEMRAALDREFKGKGDPLKVGLNSTYGAMAEQTTDTPYWQCLSWAGMTTSGVRAKVLRAIYEGDPADTVGVATDCIYSLVRRADLVHDRCDFKQPHTKILGSWEESIDHDGCCFVQSGITLPLKPDHGKLKSRGIPARNLAAGVPKFLETWERDGCSGSVKVLVHHFYGGKIATIRPEFRNTWCDETREISFSPLPKRRDPFELDGIVRSWPAHVARMGWRDVFSEFAADDEADSYEFQRALALEQPDWHR